MKRLFYILPAVLIIALFISDNANANWTTSPDHAKAFIENKAQFNGRNKLENSNILFAIDHGPFQVYFTKEGLTYRLDKKLPRKKWDKSIPFTSEAEWKKFQAERRKINMESDIIHMNWLNSNANVEIVALEQTSDYFSYGMGANNLNYNFIKGYKKILYKNLYNNIDALYEFHPIEGFKYSFIIHPGADPSQIKMKYSDDATLSKDEDGKLLFKTQFGNITEHAPKSFYNANINNEIGSGFSVANNTISFNLAKYDRSQKIIIDPWVVMPSSPNSNKVWEVESDNSGNVYTYSGDSPITLRKYNSAGALQWSYLSAWDSSSWIGGMITHPSGDTYMTLGSNGEIRKINTSGSQVWYNNPATLTSYEYWSLAFNCDLTKLVIGGTRAQFGLPFPTLRGTVMDINLNNGSLVSTTIVGYGNLIGIPPNVQEVSSICYAPNGNYYFLTLDTVGAIKDDLTAIIFKEATSYQFDYYIPGYGFGTKQPISAIRATASHFFTHNGITIHKRDLNTGAVVGTASIPSGISTNTIFGTKLPGSGGLDIDSCGNVYVGSGNGVYKFDANLNLITSASTPGPVYDVDVTSYGEVAASGSNFVTSVALSACNLPVAICITTMIATASSTNILCAGQCTGTASANQLGGTAPFTYLWSNGATTQNISMLCPGTYTVVITDATLLVDSATVTITEPLPISTSVTSSNASCGSSNGTATVNASGGTGSFTYLWSPTGGTDSIATGLSAGNYSVTTTDANGCTVLDTINVNSAGGPTVTVVDQMNAFCYGSSSASVQVSATAGTPPYSYSWNTIPVQTTPQIANLPAGSYTVTVTDSLGCTSTQTVLLTEPDSISVSFSAVSTDLCGQNTGSATATAVGGTPGYSYVWNTVPVQGGPTAINLPVGTYIVTVTDSNFCTTSESVTIIGTPAPEITIDSTTNVLCGGGTTGSAIVSATSGTAPYTFVWSTNPVQTGPVATNLSAGTYLVVVSDLNGCMDSIDVVIAEANSLTSTTATTPASCSLNNGTATINVSGGTPGYTYGWNTFPVQTGATATNLPGGTYSVTVSDVAGCSITATVVVTEIPPYTTSSSTNPVCGPATGSASVTVSGGVAPFSYNWSPSGGNSSTATGLSNGTYTCTVIDATGCVNAVVIDVVVYPEVLADAGSDVTIEPGNSTTLTASGGNTYVWSPADGISCINCQSTVASPEATTTYCVTVTDDNGCTGNACVKVIIDIDCGEVYVPNAFSPNGSNDPENEKQCVYGKCIQTMEFAIYTRWGEKVFETTDQSKCWDGTYKGKEMNTGVYVYYLKASLLDGSRITRKGDISLIR